MKITELEERSHLSRDTIRYYEKLGLLLKPSRNSNNYREYSKSHLRDLLFIQESKSIGFNLKEIKRGLETYRVNQTLCKEFKKELAEKKRIHEDQIKKSKEALKKISKILR